MGTLPEFAQQQPNKSAGSINAQFVAAKQQ
jgi:hypothetical protein